VVHCLTCHFVHLPSPVVMMHCLFVEAGEASGFASYAEATDFSSFGSANSNSKAFQKKEGESCCLYLFTTPLLPIPGYCPLLPIPGYSPLLLIPGYCLPAAYTWLLPLLPIPGYSPLLPIPDYCPPRCLYLITPPPAAYT